MTLESKLEAITEILIPDDPKLSNKIGGVLFGLTVLLMILPFSILVNISEYNCSVENIPAVWVTIAFFLITLVAVIIIVATTIGEDPVLSIGSCYVLGNSPITHFLVAIHGFVVSIIIWLGTDTIISKYGSITSDLLKTIMSSYGTCILIYIITAVVASLICLWQITSSDGYKLGMSLRHDKYVFKKEEKEATKHIESTSEFNERIEQFIADLSSMDADTIDHGEISEVKQ